MVHGAWRPDLRVRRDDKGLDALARVTAHQRARNRHGVRAGYDMAPLEPYTAFPHGSPPVRFSYGFIDMRDLVGDSGRGEYRAFERHLDAVVDATLDAWLHRNVANDAEKW